jgi:hypothetical protein
MATSRATGRPAARATPGTYFLSLTVENVRGFGPAQTLDLSDGHGRHAPWTVILGENGLGKTTLLTSLAYIAQEQNRVDEQFLGAKKSDAVGAHSLEQMWVWRTLIRGSSYVKARIQAVVSCFEGSRKAGRRTIEFKSFGARGTFVPSKLGARLLSFHYGASRRMPELRSLAGDDHRVSLFLDDDVILRDPEDWLLKADYNAHLAGAGPDVAAVDARRFAAFAERVQNALVSILPEVAELRIHAADEPGGSPRVEAKTPDGWVPLRRLGFGYQSQTAWLVDFASRMFERYPDSPDPLAEPAVVLVDEIDLHMHPRWQRQIISCLTDLCPNTQFVVTAHSPLVVQAAPGANIVLLRREGDHVVIENDPEVLENWRVDQILTSELFGLDSARPPQIEAELKERRALLAKPKLTGRDRARLAELEAQIGDLPAGESAEDRRAMELIRRAAEKLQSSA